jgi:hypothetical protein
MKNKSDDEVKRTIEGHTKIMAQIENDHKRKRKADTEKHETLVSVIDDARKMADD